MAGDPLQSIFPERRIVRFAHRQDRQVFFSMVDELVTADDVVLDFGAGRNRFPEYGPHLERLATLRGRCAKVIGVDVDEAVLTNDSLDEAHQVAPDEPLPLADASVDLVFSYAVFEHISDPTFVAAELHRVVKPGGWVCAWTPNKWGYIGIGARLVPSRRHAKLLETVQPGSRGHEDVFSTRYLLNTRSAVGEAFGAEAWDDFSFTFNGQPSYNFGSAAVARLIQLYMVATPAALAQGLFVFLRKKGGPVSPVSD